VEATRIFTWINDDMRSALGSSYQGAATDPAALGDTADRDGDRAVSRLELLLALPSLVRPAYCYWSDELGAHVARL
jgi:hypothetical protein